MQWRCMWPDSGSLPPFSRPSANAPHDASPHCMSLQGNPRVFVRMKYFVPVRPPSLLS